MPLQFDPYISLRRRYVARACALGQVSLEGLFVLIHALASRVGHGCYAMIEGGGYCCSTSIGALDFCYRTQSGHGKLLSETVDRSVWPGR